MTSVKYRSHLFYYLRSLRFYPKIVRGIKKKAKTAKYSFAVFAYIISIRVTVIQLLINFVLCNSKGKV